MEQQSYAWEQANLAPPAAYIFDYTFADFANLVQGWGFKQANAQAIFVGLLRRWYGDYDHFPKNTLPKALVARLNGVDGLGLSPFQQVDRFPSRDGSVKYLFHLARGGQVEAITMPADNRTTLCISSQVGCALGCTFCATGAMGFGRHLTAGEMTGEVLWMLQDRFPKGGGWPHKVNVVFMGMGEPLHNLNQVLKTYDNLTHTHGMALSDRDVAVSTSGLVPKIEQMAQQDRRPQLMVSIAATEDNARSAIMPVNRAYPLETLLRTLERFPLRKREVIMLSYVLIEGVNDTAEDADRLAAMSKRFPSLINLIPMNEHADSPGMHEPAEARLQWFATRLMDQGAFTTIRRSRGRDVAGACGQLSAVVP